MKIWYSNYQLFPQAVLSAKDRSASARKGCLLKIEFEKNLAGYSDCCPYPEFGDKALQEQLDALINGQPTSLMEKSLYFAKQDAQSRHQKQSSYQSAIALKNHRLILDPTAVTLPLLETYLEQGYDRFKLKMGRNLARETEHLVAMIPMLSASQLLRLDFNGVLAEAEFCRWADTTLPRIEDHLEFIEDAIPYNDHGWSQLKSNYPIRLALDLVAEPLAVRPEAVDVVILKPAVQNIANVVAHFLDQNVRFVVTHYMDHAVGQMSAYCEAQQWIAKYPQRFLPSGLQADNIYLPTPFSSAIKYRGPLIDVPDGVALGFDQLLEKISWQILQ